jgi:rhodanese-related sulfurtransferase
VTDTAALVAAVCKAGWTVAQAVEWLESQDEFVPGSDLAGTHGGQRRKLLDHLATLGGRGVA